MLKRFSMLHAAVFIVSAGMILLAAPAHSGHDPEALPDRLLQHAGEQNVIVVPALETRRAALKSRLLDLYESRNWQSIWFPPSLDEATGSRRLADAVAVLEDSAREGLNPADYEVSVPADEIPGFVDRASTSTLAALELEATGAILAYAHDAATGRSDSRGKDPNVFSEIPPFNDTALIAALADPSVDVARELRALHPDHAEYSGLRRALSIYRKLAEAPSPPPVPDGPSLKPGMRDPRVAAVRERLAYFGDISVPETDPETFTPALELALVSFQRRHGLTPDGVVGPQTRAALNVDAEDRLEQIRLNFERWRWLPDNLGTRYVLVNIAAFEVTMVEDTGTVDRMNAVVGRPYRMTPVFSDHISYIEVNPTWTVPPRIARMDLLPKFQADPAYFTANDYEAFSGWGADAVKLDPATIDWQAVEGKGFPYKLRQRPGRANALGEVKVMFPNRFNVYLHDSPAKELYSKRVRAFSSGCIRLARPFDLVDWLMRQTDGPTRDEIEEIRASGKTRIVKLPETVPVHLIYATAWAGEDGQIHFRDDIYGRDALIRRAIAPG